MIGWCAMQIQIFLTYDNRKLDGTDGLDLNLAAKSAFVAVDTLIILWCCQHSFMPHLFWYSWFFTLSYGRIAKVLQIAYDCNRDFLMVILKRVALCVFEHCNCCTLSHTIGWFFYHETLRLLHAMSYYSLVLLSLLLRWRVDMKI